MCCNIYRLPVQLGVNMPAQANCKLVEDKIDSAEVELFEVYDVILFLGIIDILQEYNIKKKAEHAYKSFQFDPITISVVEPKFYSRRLISFLESVILVENEEINLVENEEVISVENEEVVLYLLLPLVLRSC